jgi:hypothetical protein
MIEGRNACSLNKWFKSPDMSGIGVTEEDSLEPVYPTLTQCRINHARKGISITTIQHPIPPVHSQQPSFGTISQRKPTQFYGWSFATLRHGWHIETGTRYGCESARGINHQAGCGGTYVVQQDLNPTCEG